MLGPYTRPSEFVGELDHRLAARHVCQRPPYQSSAVDASSLHEQVEMVTDRAEYRGAPEAKTLYVPFIEALEKRVKATYDTSVYSLPLHHGAPLYNPNTGEMLLQDLSWDKAATADLADARKRLNGKLSAIYGGETHVETLGGSTANRVALRSLLGGNAGKPQDVIVTRNTHVSTTGALTAVPNAMPYSTKLRFSRYGAALPVRPSDIASLLAEHPKAAVVAVTYPTSIGLCTDLRMIIDIVGKHNRATDGKTRVHVDQAWGAHFPFVEDGILPESALHAGADTFSTSLHKQLNAMTQTAVAGVAKGLPEVALRMKQIAKTEGTTSPSSLLLSSADAATAQAPEFISQVVKDANALRAEIAKIEKVHLIESDLATDPQTKEDVSAGYRIQVDPCKITFRLPGMNGRALLAELRAQRLVTLIADGDYVSVHLGRPVSEKEHRGIVQAIQNVVRKIDGSANDAGPVSNFQNAEEIFPNAPGAYTPHYAIYERNSEMLHYRLALDRICSDAVVSVPPGIPVITIGQRVTPEVISAIAWWKNQGTDVQGLDENDQMMVMEKQP